MNVIILAENHYNALGLIWSAGIAKHTIYLILKEEHINFVDKSKYIREVYYIKNNDDVLPIIKTVAKGIDKPLLVVSTEDYAAIVDSNFEELQYYCFTEGGGYNNSIQRYRTKSTANSVAASVGFELPKCWNIGYKKTQNLPKDIVYPVIVKSDNSEEGWKEALKTCYNEPELIEHLKLLPSSLFPLQIQQFINKEYEMLYMGCSLDGGKEVYAPVGHKKIRHYPTEYSLGSYTVSFLTSEDKNVRRLVDMSKQFLRKINYTGLFSSEFVYSKGHYYYLETNLRNDGTSILSTICGYNLLDMLCRFFSSEKIDLSSMLYKSKHYMHFVCDYHHIVRGNVSATTWLKQLITAGAYPYFYSRDIKPTIYYLIRLVHNKFKK